MEQQRLPKTYKYNLMPTPTQERALDEALWRCRDLYNAALEERKTAWDRRRVSITYYQRKAESPGLKVACSDYAEINAQVLQDVILRAAAASRRRIAVRIAVRR
jgi:putative transposase